MKTKIAIFIVILNLLILAIAAILYVYPKTKYSNYRRTGAEDRTLVYFFKPSQFSFILLNSPDNHILTIKNSFSSVNADLFQFNQQSIETMFNGWTKQDNGEFNQIIIAPSSCSFLRINISLEISERYHKLNDFDPDGPVQNNGVLKSLFCQTTAEDLVDF